MRSGSSESKARVSQKFCCDGRRVGLGVVEGAHGCQDADLNCHHPVQSTEPKLRLERAYGKERLKEAA